MKLDLSILTNSEQSMRKLWKKCFFFFYGLIFFGALAIGIFCIITETGNPEKLGESTVDGILFIFLPAFIFYHFAYKKAGTFLLALYLCLKPVDVLIKGVVIFLLLPFPYNFILFAIMVLMAIFFYSLNWKLRKINKKLQLNVDFPEEYILDAKVLSQVSSQDDLDNAYTFLTQKWPRFEKYSTHLYKQFLANLKLAGQQIKDNDTRTSENSFIK